MPLHLTELFHSIQSILDILSTYNSGNIFFGLNRLTSLYTYVYTPDYNYLLRYEL